MPANQSPTETNAQKPTLSLKAQAAAEEAAQVEKLKAVQALEEPVVEAPKEEEFISIADLASQGMDVLHEAMRKHAATPSRPVYTPPPLTARQLETLNEEQEAGRRRVKKNEEELAARPPPERDKSEGQINPVYRPNNLVPDPTKPATLYTAGSKQFDANAGINIIPGQQ